ncbi:uncharacterized aarF domain-containing protein kinase At1g71810, chloroplastic isoform X5 [Magnolia sinica]|uniref:uncharacterized aarF domain-containing protein kinase At1g71810, chloroplastic isoform X5 n=1 Tax=Magnolia sinica TaxID=86752 RepID=UPI002659C03B|nr:uncharacterized aarF domain-containing protein kinase At1g71810, chloroplastic isoform X5 [Magnolia sinica]
MLLHLPPNFSLLPSNFKSIPPPKSHFLLGKPRRIRFQYRFRCSKTLPELTAVDSFTKYSGYLFEGGASEAESLVEYDPSKIGFIYRRKPILLIRRLFQIGVTFGRWFGLRYLDSVLERSDQMFEIRAAELRAILVELGPAFVKIAQAFSSRPDVIPPAYLDELSLLQDRIAPFSTEIAFNTIEKELGLPIDMLFSEITSEPIAAASLGQVYKASLRPSGEFVAVKVQRPGVQAAISLDIFILRYLAGFIRRAGKFNTDLQAVVDEWASSLFREMDYRAEARNGLKFRNLYGELQDVFVPKMYLEQSSRRVLIMEWVEGKKLSEVKDLYLIEAGVYCSLTQLLEYGFYHADPHPGNLLRTNDGKLAYLGILLDGIYMIQLLYKFKFQIPSYFSLVIRSLAVLEGIAISFNPNYKVLSSSYPWIARKVLTDNSRQLRSTLQDLLYKEGRFRIDRLESLLTESLRARTEQSLIKKESVDTGSKVVIKQILSFTLTEKGAFVREILLEEFAKGIDALGLATMDSVTSAAISRLPFSHFPSSTMAEEDINNLRTLRRLMLLLSGLQRSENLNDGGKDVIRVDENQKTGLEEALLVLYQLPSAQDFLPILSVIPELPPESQQQLLLLPADLAGRLVSRAVARTIRRVVI